MSRTLSRTVSIVALAVVALALPLAGCNMQSGKPGAKAAVKVPPSPYAAIANGKVDVEGGVVQVAARAPGTVREVMVQEGDTVTKNEILARQEDDAQRLAVVAAQAAVAQAQSARI